MKRPLLVGVLALCAFGGVAAADAPKPPPKPAPQEAPAKPAKPVRERSELELRPKKAPFKKVVIENPLGDVRVEGYNGSSILIETQKTAPTEDALDRMRVSLVPNFDDGTVRMKTTVDGGKEAKSVGRNQVRIDLLVKAPRDAHVEAVSTSGTLEVWNMDGGGDLDTASGNITVYNVAGALSTSSVSGATSLTQVYGSIDAETVSSDLDLDSINGDRLVATASSGRIAGRRVRSRHIELTTTDGRITLEAEVALTGRVIVASMKGNVDVRVRKHGVLLVRARGARVEFDQAAQQQQYATPTTRPDGFVEAQFGTLAGNSPSALVELRSQLGMVTFGMIR
ncbi:MAG: hypothetical protein KF773_18505 [Deltaproteobacteria bacterium]|nr:hypothetical protein [Deltaproteobacteria bacterium]